MQTDMSQNPNHTGSPASGESDQDQSIASTAPGQLRVIKRNGKVVGYDDDKITVAISKAFLAVEGGTAAASSRIHETVARLTEQVTATFKRRMPSGGTIHIEEIQDQVELALMRNGEQKVARDYVLYRERQAAKRAEQNHDLPEPTHQVDMTVTMEDGSTAPLDMARLEHLIRSACSGLEDVSADKIITETVKNLYDGVSIHDVNTSMVITARTMIEVEPNYSQVTARLLMDKIRAEALQYLGVAERASHEEMNALYSDALKAYITQGIELELLAPVLGEFDLEKLGAAINGDRDLQFSYLGLQTLYDRYFIHHNDTRIELPQCFFMRVAMGLAVEEDNREERAIEFYNLLSSFDYMSSTPTLFNAGTLRPQLSSCY
ncbi:MAG: ATP cone domain-containing protein, partial [Alcanivorax sp.]